MRRLVVTGLLVAAVGCYTLPRGADMGANLRPKNQAEVRLAASEQETWFRNAGFSKMLNEPADSVTVRLAQATGLTFAGYQVPTRVQAVVNAEVGPIDDMSLYLVAASVVEMSTPSAEEPAITLATRGQYLEMRTLGPAVFSEFAAPVPAYPPAQWSPQPPLRQPYPQPYSQPHYLPR